jgi:glycosyltransferase involved in cell wall biosynthesis
MRIAIVSTFYPYRGGIAQFNAKLVRELESLGHEVQNWNFSRQYPSVLFPGKTQLVSEKDSADPVLSHRTLDSINPLSWSATSRSVAGFKPDLVLIRYWTPFLAPALGTVARILRKKGFTVLAIADNIIPHENSAMDSFLSGYFIRQVRGCFCMTREVEAQALKLLPGIPTEVRPHPVYDHFAEPVDRALARQKFGYSNDQKVLLFFGLIRPYKGLDVLIEAFAKLDDSYRLIIAGETYAGRTELQRQLENHRGKDRILWIDKYIDDQDVPELFAVADVVVLPYRSATQSGITAMAFHFGIPVIATNVGGLAETIEHGRNGLIVSAPDAGELASSINTYFDSGGFSHFRVDREAMRKKFSWQEFVGALLNFSERVRV